METLELKDLKHYLGTGLKFGKEGQAYHEFEMAGIINEFVVSTNSTHRRIGKYKPLMLPLSALTEPLPDGSIPIVELAKMISNENDWHFNSDNNLAEKYVCADNFYLFEFLESDFCFRYEMWSENECLVSDKKFNQLMVFEYLYANHFWLGDQSLFETGEIIDKRTLK